MTFDGCEHYGSFDAAARNAMESSRSTGSKVRNELFFSASAARHVGEDFFVDDYAELLPYFKNLIAAQQKGQPGGSES